MAGGRDLRLRFFGPSGPGPHGRFRPSSGWPLYEQEDDEGMCWNRARPPSPPNPHGIPLRAVKVRGLACLCVGEMPAWGLRCERMLPPSPRWPGWSCEDATAGASSSGAAPEFPNHGAATCAWHDGRVVTGTRGPAGQASILLSLRRRNEAPRLHCAYRRGRCGPGPCLYAVPRPPTATPRLLSPGGDAPRPGPGTTGRPDGEETWSPTPQHRPDNCRRNGDPPLGREQTPRANGNLATGGRLWLPGGDPRRRRRDGP